MSDAESTTRRDRLPLIVLPGMHGTDDLYDRFLDAFPSRIVPRIIVYPEDRMLGYDELLPFVEERLPGERFALLADSFSGPLAVRIAARYPDRVLVLILSNTFVSSPVLPVLRPLRPLVRAAAIGSLTIRFAVRFLLLNGLPKGEREPCVEMLRRGNRGVIAARIREVMRVDAREDFARVRLPVLVLSAARDRIVRPEAVREMRRIRPEIEVETFDSPHVILYVRAGDAAGAVVRFIEGTGLSRISQR